MNESYSQFSAVRPIILVLAVADYIGPNIHAHSINGL